jgi:hypothetical protein
MDEFRIRELLEEVLNSGRTPQEVCAEYPELLPAVERRLRQIRRVEHGLETLFPSSAMPPAGATPPARENQDELGQIRGKPILERPVNRLQGVAKWARRRPVLVAFFVLVVVLLAALVGKSIWARQEKAPPNDNPRRGVRAGQAIEPANGQQCEPRDKICEPRPCSRKLHQPMSWESASDGRSVYHYRSRPAISG